MDDLPTDCHVTPVVARVRVAQEGRFICLFTVSSVRCMDAPFVSGLVPYHHRVRLAPHGAAPNEGVVRGAPGELFLDHGLED